MNIFQRATERLSEPSTWAGFSTLGMLFGAAPGALPMFAQVLAGIAAAIAVVHPESAAPDRDRKQHLPPTPISLPPGSFVIGPDGGVHSVPPARVRDPFVVGGSARE